MPTTAVTKLARDADGRYFEGPWDGATDTGQAWRGANVAGGFSDGRVVLYDHAGNPLMVAAAALSDAMANPSTTRIGAHLLAWNGATWDRVKSDNTGAVRASLYGKSTAAGDTPVLLDNSGRVMVNPVAGQAGVSAGAGATNAATQRVTLASDDPTLALLGPTSETAPATNAVLSGLNGRLQALGDLLQGLINIFGPSYTPWQLDSGTASQLDSTTRIGWV